MSKQSEPKQALNQHSHIYKESCIICGCSKGNISKDGRVAMSVFFLSTANSKKQKKYNVGLGCDFSFVVLSCILKA